MFGGLLQPSLSTGYQHQFARGEGLLASHSNDRGFGQVPQQPRRSSALNEYNHNNLGSYNPPSITGGGGSYRPVSLSRGVGSEFKHLDKNDDAEIRGRMNNNNNNNNNHHIYRGTPEDRGLLPAMMMAHSPIPQQQDAHHNLSSSPYDPRELTLSRTDSLRDYNNDRGSGEYNINHSSINSTNLNNSGHGSERMSTVSGVSVTSSEFIFNINRSDEFDRSREQSESAPYDL